MAAVVLAKATTVVVGPIVEEMKTTKEEGAEEENQGLRGLTMAVGGEQA